MENILYNEKNEYQEYLRSLYGFKFVLDDDKLYLINKNKTSEMNDIWVEFIDVKTGKTFTKTFTGLNNSYIKPNSQSKKTNFNYINTIYINKMKFNYMNRHITGNVYGSYDLDFINELITVDIKNHGTYLYTFDDYVDGK